MEERANDGEKATMKFERNDILDQLRENIESGQPIIGAGAGTMHLNVHLHARLQR